MRSMWRRKARITASAAAAAIALMPGAAPSRGPGNPELDQRMIPGRAPALSPVVEEPFDLIPRAIQIWAEADRISEASFKVITPNITQDKECNAAEISFMVEK